VLGEFEYVRARSIGDASRLLTEAKGAAAVLAGGTDLLVDVRNGLRHPKLLVDIKRVEGLTRLDVTREEEATIGAAVPLNRIVETRAMRDRFPALVDAVLSIATYQLRHRATIGGNLCNASPAADSIPPLLVAGATLRIAGTEGLRKIRLDGFCTGAKTTCLEPGEILTEIRIPALEPGTRTAFLKQQRIRGHDLAVVNLAGSLIPGEGGLRIAIGSCGPIPILLDPIGTKGHTTDAVATEAVRVATAAISPIDDVRATAAYRHAVLRSLIRRLVTNLLDGKGVE
jgi:CO/xanthine dehydrogenase FAD-binding subunit